MKVLKGKNEMPMNIAQRIDEKSGVICLGLTFTIGVMTNKMLNWYQKVSRSLSKIFICIRNILFSSFRKCYGLLDSQLPLTRCQPLKTQGFCIFCELSTFSCISILVISGMVTPKPLTIPFAERFQQDLSGALKYYSKTVNNVLLSSAENTKNDLFLTFQWP